MTPRLELGRRSPRCPSGTRFNQRECEQVGPPCPVASCDLIILLPVCFLAVRFRHQLSFVEVAPVSALSWSCYPRFYSAGQAECQIL
jgi:hypothetical protein